MKYRQWFVKLLHYMLVQSCVESHEVNAGWQNASVCFFTDRQKQTNTSAAQYIPDSDVIHSSITLWNYKLQTQWNCHSSWKALVSMETKPE